MPIPGLWDIMAGQAATSGGGGGGGLGPAPVLTYVTSIADPANTTAYTFAGASIGTAAANRFVVVAATGRGSSDPRTVSSLTIGGAAATELKEQTSDEQDIANAIYGLTVASGATADIIVTFSGAMIDANIGIWTITGLNSTTPTASRSDTGALSTSISVDQGGCVIASVAWETTTAMSFSGVTERYDAAGSTYRAGGGDASSISATTGRTVSCSGVSNDATLVVVAFR